ncbi:MAG TPA: dTMP kinase [Thermomicrobiales bacterium]|nr:dTMP kinase [Thermomicrobiales bacterium]
MTAGMGGCFIVFEGSEGSGKSTQARRLAEWLRGGLGDVVLTREPGGTPLGERIRALLLAQDAYAMLPEAEALLYAAARAQHVGDVVRPALERSATVVCDRFVDSSIAYQAGGHGLPLDQVEAIQRLAVGDVRPDLRLLLDLPIGVGLARRFAAGEEINRIDRAEAAFHERVRRMYLRLAAQEPSQWVVIDAARPADTVFDEVVAAVALRLPELWTVVAARRQPAAAGGTE